jgi:polygalacturonase
MCNCQNIRISGLTLKNCASWNVHMIYSDKIITNDCTFYLEGRWNPCKAIELCGFDEPGHEVKDIVFDGLCLGMSGDREQQTISLQMCQNITFKNIRAY